MASPGATSTGAEGAGFEILSATGNDPQHEHCQRGEPTQLPQTLPPRPERAANFALREHLHTLNISPLLSRRYNRIGAERRLLECQGTFPHWQDDTFARAQSGPIRHRAP